MRLPVTIRPSRPVLAAVLLALAWPAHAACTPPVPPDIAARPARPSPPVKSACVDAKIGTEGCKGWEAYSFNDEVKAYNAKLPTFQAAANAYVAKLNAYVSASADYAKCEVNSLN